VPADVRPYLVPNPESVRWEPWTFWDRGNWSALPAGIDGWDPGTDLHVRRTIRIDVERLLHETGLTSTDSVVGTVSWTSSTSGMTEAAPAFRLDPSGIAVADAVLLGDRLGGVVRLRTTLSLATSPQRPVVGVAWLPGSIFVEDEHRLALEGTLSMFPVHDVDFSHTTLAPDASWHLETTTELTAPFLGTFRLLINRRDTELLAAVSRGTKDNRQQALCDDLEHGVAMVMLELAISLREELADSDIWPPDSVADVLNRTLTVASEQLLLRSPTGPNDVSEFRTQLAGIARAVGFGRTLR
jgi:hypothetical protein